VGQQQGHRLPHLQYLQPGRVLLLATGTQLAPFMCLIRDPAVFHYQKVVLIHRRAHRA
jgi:ferredoxin-NADP reductase